MVGSSQSMIEFHLNVNNLKVFMGCSFICAERFQFVELIALENDSSEMTHYLRAIWFHPL